MTLWTFLAFVPDAIAIAARRSPGARWARDVTGTREVTAAMVFGGARVSGVVTGVLLVW